MVTIEMFRNFAIYRNLCIAVFFIFVASKALYWTLYHADLLVFRNFSHGC